MNAAAHGGKAAQQHVVAPWPYHPLAIENPAVAGGRINGLVWGVIDMRKGHGREALVGSTTKLRSLMQADNAAEIATQLAYDLHELARTGVDEDYLAHYIQDTARHTLVTGA